MSNPPPADSHDESGRFTVKTTSDSHFSWIRTRLSIERTLMSWVRTATALIGFGFTIVQFFERFANMENVAAATRPQMPRYIGLMLIALGVAGLLISIWQYRKLVTYLFRDFKPIAGVEHMDHGTPLLTVAIALVLIGIFAFFAVFTRLL